MTRTAATRPARFALALTAAGALAGGVWVAEAHPRPPHFRALPSHAPHRVAAVSPTSFAITSSTSLVSYSRTSSATPTV